MYNRAQKNGKNSADSTTNQLTTRPFKVESVPQHDPNENTVVQNKEMSSGSESALLTNIQILRPGGYEPPIQPRLQMRTNMDEPSESLEPQHQNTAGSFLNINDGVIQNQRQQYSINREPDNSWGLGITRATQEVQQTPPPGIQTKLTIGEPGDKYEQEANRVAADVVQRINAPQSKPEPTQQQTHSQRYERIRREIAPMIPNFSIYRPDETSPPPPPTIQMKLRIRERGEEQQPTKNTPVLPLIQRVNLGGMAASPDVEAGIQRARGGGQPLSDSIREPMEQAFGADFRGVRVHTDSQADQLNQSIQAKAFTTGQDVFFQQGAYKPGNRGGQELLAHELTHVLQQKEGKGIQRLLMDEESVRWRREAVQKIRTAKGGTAEKQYARGLVVITYRTADAPKRMDSLMRESGGDRDQANSRAETERDKNARISIKDAEGGMKDALFALLRKFALSSVARDVDRINIEVIGSAGPCNDCKLRVNDIVDKIVKEVTLVSGRRGIIQLVVDICYVAKNEVTRHGVKTMYGWVEDPQEAVVPDGEDVQPMFHHQVIRQV